MNALFQTFRANLARITQQQAARAASGTAANPACVAWEESYLQIWSTMSELTGMAVEALVLARSDGVVAGGGVETSVAYLEARMLRVLAKGRAMLGPSALRQAPTERVAEPRAPLPPHARRLFAPPVSSWECSAAISPRRWPCGKAGRAESTVIRGHLLGCSLHRSFLSESCWGCFADIYCDS